MTTPKSPKQKTTITKELLEAAVEKGDVGAMFNLALMYQKGQLGAPDMEKAKSLLEQAITLKHPSSMYHLDLMYQSNDLGKPDPTKANLLFKSAADLGHERASTFVRNPMIEELLNALETQHTPQELITEIETILRTLEEAFFAQRRKHLVQHPAKLAHFTTWPAIESILSPPPSETPRTCLRQYHVDYMNDPSEGKRLISFAPKKNNEEIDEEAIQTSKLLRQLFDEHYFNSFKVHSSTAQLLPSVFTVSLTEESDRLDLWRAYGQDGNGYCLVLSTEQTQGDEIVTMRNRSTSCEFLTETPEQEFESKISANIPLLYRIFYSDEEVAATLNALSAGLKGIFALKERISEPIWNQISSCATAILLELLYLFKDEQYSTEKEARALTALRLSNPKIKIDERSPGRLYCETPAFLFQTTNSEILLGPKVPTPAAGIWNIRHRLSKLGLADNVVVRTSNVPYR